MRILWQSNSLHVNTGYGTQTRYAIKHLSELGHKFANFAYYGLQGGELQAGDVVVFPAVRDKWGRDYAGTFAEKFNADVVVTLMDIWLMDKQLWSPGYADSLPCPWIAWFPVDGEPASPMTVRAAKEADYPVVYSKFGERMMEEAGVECDYIPHGIDCSIFCPGDKIEARRKFGIPPDAFVVSMVAANNDYPSRKAFPENLAAFKRFQTRHPDALLYLHTDMKPQVRPGGNALGVNINTLLNALDMPDCTMNVDQDAYATGAISDQYMRDVYRASDVLLASSCGEGFGLPIAEAQACGCPVITTYFSSMAELTSNGIATEPLEQRMYLPGAFWQAIPNIDVVDEALEAIYNWSEDKRQWKSDAGVEIIQANYDWPHVVENYWEPFLTRVESELW